MGKVIDMVGQRFGRLTVTAYYGPGNKRHHLWLCKCDCGKAKVVTRSNLISGTTKSCGCLLKEKMPYLVNVGEQPQPQPQAKQEKIEICEQGAANLIKAIIRQASNDVMHLPPSSWVRADAIQFFKSDYFKELTGLEGEPILRHLLEEYERKHQKKHKEIKK